MDLLGVLQQTGPVFLLELLLAQVDLDVLAGVVDFALLGVDLGVELELEVVCLFKRVGVAGEGQRVGLEIQLETGRGDVRDADGQEDDVLGLISGGGPLCPEDCRGRSIFVSDSEF